MTDASVEVTPAANCPDGSDRWAHGTTLDIRAHGTTQLAAWEDAPDADEERTDSRITYLNHPDGRLYADPADDQVRGTVSASGIRTLTLEHALDTTAHFYVAKACSSIYLGGGLQHSEMRLIDVGGGSGCGPGRYWDDAKVTLQQIGRISWTRYSNDCNPYRDLLGQARTQPTMDKNNYLCDVGTFPHTPLLIQSLRDDALVSLFTAELRQQAPPSQGG